MTIGSIQIYELNSTDFPDASLLHAGTRNTGAFYAQGRKNYKLQKIYYVASSN